MTTDVGGQERNRLGEAGGTDEARRPRGWSAAIGATIVSLIFPVRYNRGLVAYSVILFGLLILSGGPGPVLELARESRLDCLRSQTVGTCAADGHEIALDEIGQELAGGLPVQSRVGESIPGISVLAAAGLDGAEEAVLLVPQAAGPEAVYLGALVSGGDLPVVRIGGDGYAVDAARWRVVGMDIGWEEARGWPETGFRKTVLKMFVAFGMVVFAAPVVLMGIGLRAATNAVRGRHVPFPMRVAMSLSLGPLWTVSTGLVAIAVLISFVSLCVGLVTWAWSCLSTMSLVAPNWLDSRLALSAYVAFAGAALWFTVLDACESLNWFEEVPDLGKLLEAKDCPGAAARAATMKTTLHDREVLRVIDEWPEHEDGRGVLPAIGISPPPLPWRREFFATTGSDDEILRGASLAAWRHHLGIERLPKPVVETDAPAPSARVHLRSPEVRVKEGAGIQERRDIDAREASARYARVDRLLRLIADDYIQVEPTRLVLSDLGRSTLALPALSLVDELPFDVRRDLAAIEGLVMRGAAQNAIQQCGRFLERYLKVLLVAQAPRAFPSPEWCDEAFTRGWVVMLGDRGGAPPEGPRGEFVEAVRGALRSAIVLPCAPKGWSDLEVKQLEAALDAPGHETARATLALRALATGMLKDNRASKALREYLRALGVPGMEEETSPAEKDKWPALAREVQKRVRDTSCAAVAPAYAKWHAGFREELSNATLYPLLKSTTALLTCLAPAPRDAEDARRVAARYAGALADQWSVARKVVGPIVDARNQAAHDRGDADAHIDTPEVVSLALHTLWLTRIFVASVEKVRERRPTVERGVEGVS